MQEDVLVFIYIFESFGIYDVKLIVIDIKGEQFSVNKKIMAGNEFLVL